MRERLSRPDQQPQSDILQRFEQAVGAIQDSESFRRWLDISARFHKYSLGNQLLIALQKPEATYVAGYHAWLKMGRYVKKGERGIAIMVPHVRKVETEQGEEEKRITSFGTGRVFDLSQTDGEPLPMLDVPTLEGEAGGELWGRLSQVAKQEGCTVEVKPAEHFTGETMGYYLPATKAIVVRDSFQRQKTKTLAHELGHAVARVDDRGERVPGAGHAHAEGRATRGGRPAAAAVARAGAGAADGAGGGQDSHCPAATEAGCGHGGPGLYHHLAGAGLWPRTAGTLGPAPAAARAGTQV